MQPLEATISWSSWASAEFVYVLDRLAEYEKEIGLTGSSYSYKLYSSTLASRLYDYNTDMTGVLISDLGTLTEGIVTISSTTDKYVKLVVEFDIGGEEGYLLSDVLFLPKLPEQPLLTGVEFDHRGDYVCNYETGNGTDFVNIGDCGGKARVSRYYYDPGQILLSWDSGETEADAMSNYNYILKARSNVTSDETLSYNITESILRDDLSIGLPGTTTRPLLEPGPLLYSISSTPFMSRVETQRGTESFLVRFRKGICFLVGSRTKECSRSISKDNNYKYE